VFALFGLPLQDLADRLLAPFVTLGTVAGGGAVITALLGYVEARVRAMPPKEADAHIQSRYNDGLVRAGAAAVIPVVLLFIEAFR
jgi:hypothetical protein